MSLYQSPLRNRFSPTIAAVFSPPPIRLCRLGVSLKYSRDSEVLLIARKGAIMATKWHCDLWRYHSTVISRASGQFIAAIG
ncbi:hypothetical protein Y032_0116g544 [Ancylostoma ceylanicum]|uniref:Uncharacterized protein n=1 Tax=Ancylostoma ceylanicum TaxID=53326 RepID=A0A016TCD2_9BILA|nr:hypothetical protein Y032_0116g544 [Ancylostoma ceylanicum]